MLTNMKTFMHKNGGANFAPRALHAALVISIALLASCRSTKFVDERTQIMADGLEINASDDFFKIYDADFSDPAERKDSQAAAQKAGDKALDGEYIFMRLYYPDYDNKASSVNMLKNLIILADPNPELASHSSIGFGLEDDFYGLTLYSRKDLKKESCLLPEENLYMKLCNPYRSTQTTLAIKVTPEEYEAAKKMLEKDFAEQKVKYWATKNLIVGVEGFRRKKMPREKSKLGGRDLKKGYISSAKKQKHFVCSTYLAYVLQTCVKKVDDFFKARNVAYDKVSPTDLYYIPGFKVLFSSTWIDYKIAAQEFVRAEPQFSKYFTD